jgi:hypothetical protein
MTHRADSLSTTLWVSFCYWTISVNICKVAIYCSSVFMTDDFITSSVKRPINLKSWRPLAIPLIMDDLLQAFSTLRSRVLISIP